MKAQDKLSMVGRLQVFKNGVRCVDDKNLIVDMGTAWVAEMIIGDGVPMSVMRIGDSQAKPLPTDEDIQGNLLGEIPMTNNNGTAYVNTVEFIASAAPGIATGPVQEVVIANQFGTILARKAFATVNKDVNDVMSFIWTVTVLAG